MLGLGLTLALAAQQPPPADLADGELDFSETTESALIVLFEDI